MHVNMHNIIATIGMTQSPRKVLEKSFMLSATQGGLNHDMPVLRLLHKCRSQQACGSHYRTQEIETLQPLQGHQEE